MPVTGDSSAVAIATFKAVPLSMGDCFFKVTPRETAIEIEVTAQFIAFDSASPVAVSPAVRLLAEGYLTEVLSLVGGIATTSEFSGPKGKRIVVPASYTPGTLINPYSGASYAGAILSSVEGADTGGKFFPVTYKFLKPISGVDDGTLASSVLFNGIPIGDSGGAVTATINPSSLDVKTTSLYKGATSLTYLQSLSTSLGLEPSFLVEQPRGAANKRSVIKTFAGTIGNVEWVGRGIVTSCILQTLDMSESAPGIMQLNASFKAAR